MQSFDLAPIGGKSLWWSVAILGAVLVLLVLALLIAALLLQKPTVELGADGLRIVNPVFGRTIPLSKLELAQARRIDIAVPSGLQPKWRTMGIGLPGFKAGWFSLENGSKALLFVTGATDAVYVPTKDDYALIVTPADPDAFLMSLRNAGR